MTSKSFFQNFIVLLLCICIVLLPLAYPAEAHAEAVTATALTVLFASLVASGMIAQNYESVAPVVESCFSTLSTTVRTELTNAAAAMNSIATNYIFKPSVELVSSIGNFFSNVVDGIATVGLYEDNVMYVSELKPAAYSNPIPAMISQLNRSGISQTVFSNYYTYGQDYKVRFSLSTSNSNYCTLQAHYYNTTSGTLVDSTGSTRIYFEDVDTPDTTDLDSDTRLAWDTTLKMVIGISNVSYNSGTAYKYSIAFPFFDPAVVSISDLIAAGSLINCQAETVGTFGSRILNSFTYYLNNEYNQLNYENNINSVYTSLMYSADTTTVPMNTVVSPTLPNQSLDIPNVNSYDDLNQWADKLYNLGASGIRTYSDADVYTQSINNLVGGVNTLVQDISGTVTDIKTWVQNIANTISSSISTTLTDIKTYVQDLIDSVSIGTAAEDIPITIKNIDFSVPIGNVVKLISGYTLFINLFSHFLPASVATMLWAFFLASICIYAIRFLIDR